MKEFLNRFNLTLIIVTYSAVVMALYPQLNVYIVLFGIACATWRAAHYLGRAKLLTRFVLSSIALIASLLTVILLFQQGLFIILLHLIFLGFSLKFLELRAVRDVYFFVNTGFVLIALYFIFNTSFTTTFIAIILVFLLLAILLSLHADNLRSKAFNSLLIKSVLLSLPLAALLFVVMPRLPSLWKMPIQKQATTGLSDSVSPGEIAKLSRSSKLAFRATFTDKIPAEHERYWRAMTLDNFDGSSWSQSNALKQQEAQAKKGRGLTMERLNHQTPINSSYELIIEPHYNYWLPALDYTLTAKGLVSLQDYSLRSGNPVNKRQAFTLSRVDQIPTESLSASQTRQLTQLPFFENKTTNSKTERWIADKMQSGKSKKEILSTLLALFSTNFTYTLQPPLLGKNQIDDFLFNTQAGFCVHYASSFLYVARRLGFPARMVTGYLGGEWQASEGFFTVRQYDAHAWVEIWENERWQRIDPTAYVAPERVESGLAAGLTDNNEFLANEYFSLQKWQSNAFLNEIRLRVAQLDYLWVRYIVNFDNQKQLRLLQYWLLTFPWLDFTYALLFIMISVFTLLLVVIFKPWQRDYITPEDRLYLLLQKHFKTKGIVRQKQQTVGEYCELLATQVPCQSDFFSDFARYYNAIKYQPSLPTTKRNEYLQRLKMINKRVKKKL